MDNILNFIKKFIPKKLFKTLQPVYHFCMGYLAALWYGHPSNKMIVIGITGTTGKTTSVFLASSILKSAGLKVGYITTAMFSNGEEEWLNDKKMTMPGRFFVQRILKQMADNKCDVAVIETTSEGIIQFRHRFTNYDTLVFTGLYSEHIESHGNFENYKKAKGQLFAHLENCKRKTIKGREIKKTIIANADDESVEYFLDFWADKKMKFGVISKESESMEFIRAENINTSEKGISFEIKGTRINTKLLGEFNAGNALAATSVAMSLGIPINKIKEGLETIKGIPGRLESINEGQNFTIIVDYAFEPNAVAKLYETMESIPHNKIIHVLGSTGGGRDKARRPKLGKLAAGHADYIVVTDEDPYDEDPKQIIDEVASGINNKEENKDYWKILDRREGIKKALSLAGEKDIVLITGKGNEQAICIADGKKIPWDDREITREVLKEM